MEIDGKTVMKAPDGRLFQVDPAQAKDREQNLGWSVAPDEEVTTQEGAREAYAENEKPGNVALGLAETATRNLTLGAVTSLDGDEEGARSRAQHLDEEHPVLNTAAGIAPALAAGIATGGSSIPVEAAIGGLGGLGAAQDAAFRHDQELSTEAALGSFIGGAILGGGVAAGGKVLGAARNRFVEASGRVARKAEQEAFEAAGVVRPVKNLSEAVKDPIKAAELRQAGNNAREAVGKQMSDELITLDSAEKAARQFSPEVAEVGGDALAQRSAARRVIAGARDELERFAPPETRGIMYRAMEDLDAASTGDEIFQVAGKTRAALDEALDSASDPTVARILSKYADEARSLEQNADLFGAPANDAAQQGARLRSLGEAREALRQSLDGESYLNLVGTKSGQQVDQNLDTYMDRLTDVLNETDAPAAKEGLAAIGRLRSLREGDLQTVAGGNQADALRQFQPKPRGGGQSIAGDIAGELAETAVESVIPGAGLVRKAWKYRNHIARLAGFARGDASATADRLLQTTLSSVKSGSRGLSRAAVPLASRAAFFRDLDENPEKAYLKVRGAVQMLIDEPERLTDALAHQMGDATTEAPELLEQISAKAARAVDFLSSKIPPAFEYSILYPDGPPPSRTDVLELSLYWQGVTQPEEVLRAIGDGSAMPEEVEAFRAVSPAWFTELQDALQDRIVQKNRSGQIISGYRVAQLEGLLDLPGKLDPAFSDSVALTAQATEQAQQQAQQSPSYVPTPKAGQRVQSESLERIKS